MKNKGLFPTLIASSPARRTWQTVIAVYQALKVDLASVNFGKRLSLAGMRELCQVIVTMDSQVNSLLVVGHNPGLEDLAVYLLGEGSQLSSDRKILATATLCALHLPDWSQLENASAQLFLYQRPRSL